MDIWMSMPMCSIPNESSGGADSDIDPLYKEIFNSLSHELQEEAPNLKLPRVKAMSNEEFASSAISMLLNNECNGWVPDMLIDCRSSAAIGGPAPTYRLEKTIGLTTTLPILLEGQGGTEVVQALLFIKHMEEALRKGVILSALQRVVIPDHRRVINGYSLGDACASVGFAGSPLAFGKSFHILNALLKKRSNNWSETINDLSEEILSQQSISRKSIDWIIVHRYSKDFLEDLHKIYQERVQWLERDEYQEINFGCCDPFITLYNVFSVKSNPPKGLGLIWFVGRFDTLGAVLVNSDSVSLWNAYTHNTPAYISN